MSLQLKEVAALVDIIISMREQKLPVKTAFKLNRIFLSINEHYTFYQEELQKIIKEYAKFDEEKDSYEITEDGRGYKIKPGMEQECYTKINELENLSIDLSESVKVTLEELEPLQLSFQDMNLFFNFIDEESK